MWHVHIRAKSAAFGISNDMMALVLNGPAVVKVAVGTVVVPYIQRGSVLRTWH